MPAASHYRRLFIALVAAALLHGALLIRSPNNQGQRSPDTALKIHLLPPSRQEVMIKTPTAKSGAPLKSHPLSPVSIPQRTLTTADQDSQIAGRIEGQQAFPAPPPKDTSTSDLAPSKGQAGTEKPVIRRHAGILQRIEPVYPEEARRQGQEGLIRASVHISATGMPNSITIIGAGKYPLLENALLKSLSGWQFSPAQDDKGSAIEEELIIPYRFQLHKDDTDD